MKEWRLSVACALFVGLASRVAGAGVELPVEVTDKTRIHQTVVNGFTHPGIGLNRKILEDARAQVLAKREPWHSGFIRLASSPRSSKNVTSRNQSKDDPTRPEMDAFDNGGVEGRLKIDSDTALRQILMYWFTGDEAYRANALRIVRLWAKMDPSKFKAYNEVYIHCSFAFKDMILVAELLRGMETSNPELAWTEQDTIAFSNNFVIPGVTNFFNHNGWFMNQNGFAYAPAIAGAIFRSDPEDFAKRVERFTVNKDGPNKGSSFSIQDLARLVDTNALTGEKAAIPQVQITEMGRDQAHAGDDMTIFTTIARILNSQDTKVDPVNGIPSKASDAVGVYEFLGDRILAAADHFSRFMLGYDTPWIPTPSHRAPDGTIRQIYPRIADNYRGRIRQHRMWDLYYYYAIKKGVDLSKKAPYYYETFTKRIVSDDYDWLYIPKEATGEALRIPPSEQEPAIVEVELRSANLTKNSSVRNEGDTTFVRAIATAGETRLSLLSCATEEKTVGLRIRTTGVAEVEMSGFGKPWLLPNTRGEWREVFYTLSSLERLGDIVFFNIKGTPGTTVDLDQFFRKPDKKPLVFASGDSPLRLVAYPGAPVRLDFALVNPDGEKPSVAFQSLDKPEGSVLDPKTGAFSWNPSKIEDRVFVVEAANGNGVTAKKVSISVAADRTAAIQKIKAVYDPKTVYVQASLDRCKQVHERASKALQSDSNTEFFPLLIQLKEAFDALEPLTPLLRDGSMDFPKMVAFTNIGPVAMNLLTDGNDDTFVGYYLAEDGYHDFDFGPDFKFSATAFALEGRVNFEDRVDNVKFHGSNDGKNWTELTPNSAARATELTKVPVAEGLTNKTFRFLRVKKQGGGYEPSEMRIFGRRHESGNKLESISLSSEKGNGIRTALGEPVRVTFKVREPVRNVRVRIQGVVATTKQTDTSTYVAEAIMKPGQAMPGPVEFSIDYQRRDGTPADTASVATDGSRLVLVDESKLIRDVRQIAKLIDPNSNAPAVQSQRLLDALFDNNPQTYAELDFNGQGGGAYLQFDFGPKRVQLSGVELLARPKYRDRTAGALVEGSHDGKTWTTLSEGAASTEDWQSLKMKPAAESYRYLRLFNRNNWHCNVSEVRFHGESK
ncbi:MAG TPA: discoidin domain-containing protein [Luteolibacter sp.]